MLLFRYLFRETAAATLVSLGVFTFILLIGNAIKDIIKLLASNYLPISAFFKLLLLLIPYAMVYALPIALLCGILISMGRLSSQKEITAMKCSGISLYRIARPAFFIALLCCLLSLFVNFYFSPKARTDYKNNRAQIVFNDPLKFLKPNTFINSFPGLSIYIGNRIDDQLADFWIWQLDEKKRVSVFLRAESGNLRYDEIENQILLTLIKGTAEKRPAKDPENLQDNSSPVLYFDVLPIKLPLDSLVGKTTVVKKLNMMTANELWNELNHTKDPIRQTHVKLQINQNLAMALSSFAFVFVAIPLSITIGRKETMANVALALALAILYYFSMIMVGWLKDNPNAYPHLLIWLPNLLYFGFGFRLFQKLNQH